MSATATAARRRLTPSDKDVLWVKRARQEHDAFAELDGVQVIEAGGDRYEAARAQWDDGNNVLLS